MITHNDQLELFRLIAANLDRDVSCFCFGGTAMMFYGYKLQTKDVDLLFETSKDRDAFIRAIRKLGFEETSPIKVYIPEKLRDKSRPVMYKRGDARFDLFATKIFRTQVSQRMRDDLYAIHDFKEKHELQMKVLRKEHIVFLKSITERDKDLEDIKAIIVKDKQFSWDYLVDEAIWQGQHSDTWALLDVEKTMRELKKDTFIEEKHFKRIYAAANKRKRTAN